MGLPSRARLSGENGQIVNRKRVQQLWREEGLRVPQKTRKRRRMGDPEARWLRAKRPNQLWALDYQYDQTCDGRMLRLLNIVDEFTREALVIKVGRSISAKQTFAALQALVAQRGCPENVRCDNGPKLTANALRNWCSSASVTTSYIEPGAPWQNPFAESLNARVRDELLNLQEFSCLTEAQVLAEDWRIDYNREHPHSALGYRSPATFATSWAPRQTDPLPATRRGRQPYYRPSPTTHRLSQAVDQQPGSGHRRQPLREMRQLAGLECCSRVRAYIRRRFPYAKRRPSIPQPTKYRREER